MQKYEICELAKVLLVFLQITLDRTVILFFFFKCCYYISLRFCSIYVFCMNELAAPPDIYDCSHALYIHTESE